MPLLVQVSKGLLTAQGEKDILPKLTESVLRLHGLTGNSFMTPNVVGHVVVSEQSSCYAGGKPQSLAVVEFMGPPITFGNPEIRAAFIKEATDLIDSLRAGPHPRERTYVIVKHAIEGGWGIAGKAYTSEDLGKAIASAK